MNENSKDTVLMKMDDEEFLLEPLTADQSEDEMNLSEENMIVTVANKPRVSSRGRKIKGRYTAKDELYDYGELFTHKPKKPARKKGIFPCATCGKVFPYQDCWYSHQLIHKPKIFKCRYCPKKFQTQNYCDRHEVTHQTERPMYPCRICGKCSITEKGLIIHMRDVHGNRKLQCPICDQVCKTEATLKVHIARHEDRIEIICDVCGRGFKNKNWLKSHMRIHTGHKPYQCSICNQSFMHLNEKKKHQLFCFNVTKYRCDVCNLDFDTCSQFKIHIKIHPMKRVHRKARLEPRPLKRERRPRRDAMVSGVHQTHTTIISDDISMIRQYFLTNVNEDNKYKIEVVHDSEDQHHDGNVVYNTAEEQA